LGDNETALARTTIYDYLAALQRLMLVDDVPAWSTHLRSRATLRQEPKRHFVDPSLAVAALATTPKRLLDDLSFGGLLFESLVIRDLRVLSSPLGGTVAHYRDSNGVEVDVVLHIPDGT
jgi:predicted AAA+ superfamily ATPase